MSYNFYNDISYSDATSTRARENKPTPLCTNTNNLLTRHNPREPAKYVTVPCMDLRHRSFVVAKAWVRGKSTSQPKVNLDMSGDFGFQIFGNPHAQTWFSDAIEASLWGKHHPALIPTIYLERKKSSPLLYKEVICSSQCSHKNLQMKQTLPISMVHLQ